MARKMEIRPVEGLADLLAGTLLTTPDSRMFAPAPDVLAKATQIGNAFIKHAAKQPENEGSTVYTAYQWPEDGPIHLALVWAINPRHPEDAATGGDFFFRAYTETQEPRANLLTQEQMEQELAAYAVAHFGRPTAI